MKIDLGGGAFLEPDEPPRASRFHKRILRVTPIPNTRTGSYVDLECGHRTMAFGNLDMAAGRALCEQCRNGGETA